MTIFVGFNPFWKILVNGKDDPIYYGKSNKCLKPPTSLFFGESTSILRSYSRDFEGKSGWEIQVFEVHPLLRPRWILLFILAGRWARATPRSAGFQLGLFGVCLRALTGEKNITFFGGLGGDMLRWSMVKCWLFNDLVFFKRTFEFHEFPSTFIGLK